MQDRDGELQALLLPQGQAFGPAVRDAEQIEPLEHFPNARLSTILGQAEQMRMELQVLPDGKFAVEREGLRHVSDVLARRHVVGIERVPEEQRLPFGAGKRPVSIFIVVLLPQPLEPRKPKISPRSMRKLT